MRPLSSAIASRRESGAGILAQPGSVMPSASARLVMVEAVPITVQCPAVRAMHPSTSHHSSSVMRPVRNWSNSLRPSVPEPSLCPRHSPASIGPPGTMMAGMSALAAPINCAGVVLSQPHSSTTASSGLARMDSSTSMAIRLRNIMVVGCMNISPREMVGNSSGRPPAASTPRFTATATSRRWALQLFSSLQELQMPTTGLPSKISAGKPSERSHARRVKP